MATKQTKTKRVYHITQNKETSRWQIFLEKGKVIQTFLTQKEAIARVKELSANNDRNYQIHKVSGHIRKKDYEEPKAKPAAKKPTAKPKAKKPAAKKTPSKAKKK